EAFQDSFGTREPAGATAKAELLPEHALFGRKPLRRRRATYPNVELSGWNDRQRSGAHSPSLAQGADAVLPRCDGCLVGGVHLERLFFGVKASRRRAFLSVCARPPLIVWAPPRRPEDSFSAILRLVWMVAPLCAQV